MDNLPKRRHDGNREWSPGDYVLGMQMRRNNVSYEDVATRLGRSIRAVREKLGFVPTAKPAVVQIKVPETTLADFIGRMNASPRDLTGLICGDPLEGFSELERSELRRLREEWLRDGLLPRDERILPRLRPIVEGEETPIRKLVLAARARAMRAGPLLLLFLFLIGSARADVAIFQTAIYLLDDRGDYLMDGQGGRLRVQ